MTFEHLPSGLWLGRYSYSGKLITYKFKDLMSCIYELGRRLNQIKGDEI